MNNVLVIDDDRQLAQYVADEVGACKHQAHVVHTGETAKAFMKEHAIDISAAIVDMVLPDMDGLELVQNFKRDYPSVAVIVITAFGSEESIQKAMDWGADDYLHKPFEPEELKKVLRQLLKTQRIEEKVRKVDVSG